MTLLRHRLNTGNVIVIRMNRESFLISSFHGPDIVDSSKMSTFERILMMSCLLEVGVLARSSTLTCPQGYFVEGMVSYDRSGTTQVQVLVLSLNLLYWVTV